MTYLDNELFKNAVLNEDLNTVKYLLSSGINPNIQCNKYGFSLLHLACSPEIVQELITFGADIEAKDAFGRTPLCCAFTNNNSIEVVKTLISNGANVNVRMGLGVTPLHIAPNVEITNLLLSRGAIVNITDSIGRAPIHSALIDGKGLNVFKALLTAGANVNIRMPKFKNSLLHYADSLVFTRELLLAGANVNAKKIDGQTPLHCAVRHMKETAVIRELLKWGALVNAKDNEGLTPLGLAMRFHTKNLDVIKELLKYNANINYTRFDPILLRYCTILESAVFGDLTCAKLLVKIFLLQGWDGNSNVQLKFNSQIGKRHGKEILKYKDDCVSEIIQMKSDKMFIKYTLYNLFSQDKNCVEPIYGSYRAIEKELKSKYPIYHDEIIEEVKKGLERGRLLTRLEQVYTKLKFCKGVEQEIKLNSDCLLMIARYLSDSDILNTIIIFEDHLYYH